MAPGRQKSVVSTITVDIPRPTQTTGLLNKSAASSTSLYQQCSQLRATLLRVSAFDSFLAQVDANDPVSQLWDCFALGVPLCYLFNLLPPPALPIDINTDEVDPTNVKQVKTAVAKFIMAVKRLQELGSWQQDGLFQVTELTNRHMDGFVKVVNTVAYLVSILPLDVFTAPEQPPSPLGPSVPHSAALGTAGGLGPDSPTPTPSLGSRDAERRNNINELISTERKYVTDLQTMQEYAIKLQTVIDRDTTHLLFPGLKELLEFQIAFLVKLERVYELSWPEQRWGKCFIECEHEFDVYVPYCSNYENAIDILLREESHLMELASIIHPKSELPAFLIKPIQRICKYPLMLESLLKACDPEEYPFYQELVEGAASAKRITNRVNEAQRRVENQQIMKALEIRIEDWKGHHIVNFGELLVQDFFSVTKSEVDRDYHVFLFEKIILCCKEAVTDLKKVSKSNSILKKPTAAIPTNPFPGGSAASARKGTTPLQLKGRIFLNNVLEATPLGRPGSHDLRVSWKGDDDIEHFTLRCRNEEQLKLWETHINKLISKSHSRRRTGSSTPAPNSTSPAAWRVHNGFQEKSNIPPHQSMHAVYKSSRSSTPYGRYPHDGFEPDDEFEEDGFPSSVYTTSGRGTPLGSRRIGSAQSLPPERDIPPGYDRPRARTEDATGQILQQWRTNHAMPPPPPPPLVGLPQPPSASNGLPLRTNSSNNNHSELDYGIGVHRPSLRTQMSATRLRAAYQSDETINGDAVGRSLSAASSHSHANGASRSRSGSVASAYSSSRLQHSHPPQPPMPPVYANRPTVVPQAVDRIDKRDSGSSSSTQQSSSDFSAPQSNSSPTTPYGSNESSLATVRQGAVKVKVHYGDDLFMIMVDRSTSYHELVEKVGKKIRLCGGRRDGVPLRVKYKDEDGDMVSLGSNEDVQMAFDSGQVTLFVV